MSKIKEFDLIAEKLADHLSEMLPEATNWVVGDTFVNDLEGDEYNEACVYIISAALSKLQS